MAAVWHSVCGLEDGEDVSAATFNRPLSELASRTDYLKDMLDRLMMRGDMSAIQINVELVEERTPVVGDIVCIDPETKKYQQAIASMSLYDAYTASVKAFAVGILVHRTNLSGVVVLYGKVDLRSLDMDAMVEEGVFRTGRYYLSSTASGKITRFPKGPRIFVGYFSRLGQTTGNYSGNYALINPQYMDIEAHAHRTYRLLARPAGESVLTYVDVAPDPGPSPEPAPDPEDTGLSIVGDDGSKYRLGVSGDQQLYVQDVSSARAVTDSNDDSSEAPAGEPRIIATGYYPDSDPEPLSDDGFTGVPRLVLCGDWTTSQYEKYVITVSDEYGNTPHAWPCYVTWNRDGEDEKTTVPLRFFGDSAPVGTYGMRVRLEPSTGMSESAPFAAEVSPPISGRTWTVDRWLGRGWGSASVCVPETLVHADAESTEASDVFRFGGVSEKFVNNLSAVIPEKVFDLTALGKPADKDQIVIDGTAYTFTHDADAMAPTDIQILETVYETMLQICRNQDGAYYDETLKQVVVGASSVVYRRYDDSSESEDSNDWYTDTDLDPVVTNGTVDNPQVAYALVGYERGESLSPGLILQDETVLSVVSLTTPYAVVKLRNGLTFMRTGVAAPLIGDKAETTIYCVPGAVYRYAIEYDNDLKLHFPPVPARSGSLMLNGVELESYEHYGDEAVLAIGDDSLYWRDDSPGRQPWPIPEMKQTDAVNPEDEYRELFHFVSEFHSETGPVTSLHPAKDSPVVIHRCGTDEDAIVGDLEIDVDLMIDMSDQNLSGYKVPKASRGNRLLLGPVVEKLIAGPGISFSRRAGMPEGQGIFTISADGARYAGDFETIALENAKLESIGMFPYIRLLKWEPGSTANIPTGFVAKFHMPAAVADAVYRVKFYASVFGEESFTDESERVAGIRMDYNILPDYNPVDGGILETANLKTGLIAPDPDKVFTLDVPFGVMDDGAETFSYSAYDPILVHNDPDIGTVLGKSAQVLDHMIPSPEDCGIYLANNRVTGEFGIRPGYTVAIRFSRAAPSDGEPYTGSIGFLNLRWAVEEVSGAETGKATPANIDDIVAQAVLNLKKATAKPGPMISGYELKDVLTRIVNALK